jgi:hypothetical protein
LNQQLLEQKRSDAKNQDVSKAIAALQFPHLIGLAQEAASLMKSEEASYCTAPLSFHESLKTVIKS